MISLGSAYGEILIGTGEAEKSVASLASTLRSVGTTMSLAISAPLLAVAGAGLAAAGNFEQSMNQVQVVSGATAESMVALQEEALRLGRDTSFSAGEAAEGMLELAKAGMSTEEVMASISGTLDLAAAGGLSVAQAAEISANALNTFNLDASEAGRVADLLSAAANSSSVEVTDMAQSLTMAGAVFASNKVPIEDLSTAIAILGNNGIKGSDAGTSLKTMLMRLTAPTDEAAGALRDLGIAVYNADGSMRPFDDILKQLESSTSGLTDAQRNQALTTLFGADAIRAANILIAEGSDEFDRMRESVTEAGAAQEMADARMKGFAGAIDYLKGTIESTLIEAFLPMLDALGGMMRQTADLIAQFGSVPEPVRNAALAFLGVLAAAGPVMLAISGIGAVLGALLSPVGLIILAVAALAAAWASDFLGIRTITEQALAPIAGWFNDVITLFTSGTISIGDVFGELGSILFGFNSDTYDTSEAIWSLVSTMTGSEEAATQFTDALWAIGDVTSQTVTGIQYYTEAVMDAGFGSIEAHEAITALPEALQPLALAFDSTMVAIRDGWQQLMDLLAPALSRLQEAFGTMGTQVAGLAPHFEGLLAAVGNMWTALQPIIEAFGALVATVFAVVAVLAVNLLAGIFENFGAIAGSVIDQLTLTINTFATLLGQAVTLIKAVIDGDWSAAWAAAQAIIGTFEAYFRGTFENLKEIATTIFTAITSAVTDTLTDMGVDTEGVMLGISEWWTSIWDGLKQKVQPVIDMIAEFRKTLEGFAEWVTGFSIPNPFDGWSMPTMPTMPWQQQQGGDGKTGISRLADVTRSLAQPFNAQELQGMAGRTFNITVPVQNLGSQLDMVELAHRVAGVIMGYEGA